MKKSKHLVFILGMLATVGVNAQSKIKDGSVTESSSLPNSNAVMELESNSKGLLLPRIALNALNLAAPVGSHVAGMTVYNTATAGTAPNNVSPGYYYNDGTKWVRLADAAAADPTKDAWIDDNTNMQIKVGTQSDGTTARAAGTEMVIKDNGRVGIGMDTPGKSLDVVGEARALRLIAHGKGSSIFNTAVGDSSLWNMAPTSGTGLANVGVGHATLNANISGTNNSALGASALRASLGSSNTAIGSNALRNVGLGNNNTALGKEAMLSILNSEGNTAVGSGALRNATGGGLNTAIGYEAGINYNNPSNTNDKNIFIGYHAGEGIVTGYQNTIIGGNTTPSLPAGLHNTIVLADGNGNIRIYADSNGSTGIGVVNSRSRLKVNGYIQVGSADAVADPGPASVLAAMIRYSTANKTLEYHDGADWMTVVGTQYGDLKQTLQAADHKGWILLDGRLKSSLSATQQARATALGIGTNMPDADNRVLKKKGTLASTGGADNVTLVQANLPNVSFTGTTSTDGDHRHAFGDKGSAVANNRSLSAGTLDVALDSELSNWTNFAGDHSHTVTVSSGGSGTPVAIEAPYLSVNTFIYLGL